MCFDALTQWILSEGTRCELFNLVVDLVSDHYQRHGHYPTVDQQLGWILARADEELRPYGLTDVRAWVRGPIAWALVKRQLGPDPDPDDLDLQVRVVLDVAGYGLRFRLAG